MFNLRHMPYKATLTYIILIVFVNMLFSYLPFVQILGQPVSPADITVGVIYVLRDFAQREIKHYVIVAMLIGALLSFLLADPVIAAASVTAFIIGETVDWLVYTFTKKPLSKRILWSACLSSPIDSYIFVYMIGRAHWLPWLIMFLSKMIGVLLLWGSWKIKARHHALADEI